MISDQARLENVLSRMKDNMDGRITAVCVLDNPYFTDPFIKCVKPENLIEYATHSVVDQVLINLPSEQYKIWDYASPFELMGIPVSINLNALEFMSQGEKRIQQLGPFKVVTFSTHFYSYGDILAKRFLDICGALVGLVLCGIVGIFLYPLIRKDGGPAIFAQDRVGENGRIFKFYKFRSMRVDAEEIKKNLMAQNQMSGGMFKMDNDPRITKIGHFIRKTSLDELPQLWNVLIGDMSLVGPRPIVRDEIVKYGDYINDFYLVPPGITGVWQVSGRSDTTYEERVLMDSWYVHNWSVWIDIVYLLKTVLAVVKSKGAY